MNREKIINLANSPLFNKTAIAKALYPSKISAKSTFMNKLKENKCGNSKHRLTDADIEGLKGLFLALKKDIEGL